MQPFGPEYGTSVNGPPGWVPNDVSVGGSMCPPGVTVIGIEGVGSGIMRPPGL